MTAAAVPRGKPRPVIVPGTQPYLAEIPIGLVDVGDNVRDDVGDLSELKASIEELGLIEPIKVTAQPDGRFRLVVGQRRVTAHRELERTSIRAIVEPAGDVDEPGVTRSIEQLAENLIRKDLNAIEEAVALREVLDADPELTQAELARRLGMSPSWVANTLRLQGLDPTVQELIRTESISASHGKAMAILPAKEQRELAARIVDRGMSSHDLEREIGWKVDAVKQREATQKRTDKAIPKALAALEAAGVAKTTAVYVQGRYDLDEARITAAIRAASYAVSRDYPWEPSEAAKCDCAIVRLAFDRVWKVTPGCTNDRHRDRQRNVTNQADQAARKAMAQRVAVLRPLVAAAVKEVPAAVLALAHGDYWGLPELVAKAAAGKADEVRSAVVDRLVERVDPSRVYNDRQKDMVAALDSLIEQLGGPPPVIEAPAPKPAKGKKATPAFSEAAIAAARAELDLDGEDR